MDPFLAAVCVAASLAGCALGMFTGMVPGIHVNTLAAAMLASYPALEALVPLEGEDAAVAVCCCIMAASVVHSFVDFVPSAFIGAPDAGDAVAVLPGHRLLLEGRGMEAVRAAAIGSIVGCSAAILMAVPLQWALLNGASGVLDTLTPAVLLAACAAVLWNEWTKGSGAWGPFVFLLAGALGLGCMTLPIPTDGVLGEGSVMMPLLTGLFGIPVMLESSGGARIPAQRDRVKDPVGAGPGLRGVLMGAVAGWFPGITSTVGATMSAAVFPEDRPERFISTVASIGTVTSVLSLVTMSVSGSGRSGTVLAIGEILDGAADGLLAPAFVLLLLAAAVASLAGYWLAILGGRAMCRVVGRVRPKALCRAVLVLLTALTLALNGWAGLLILGCSTAVGVLPRVCGTGRMVLCGCLILPVLLFRFGLFRSELRESLGHEARIVDDEPLMRPGPNLAGGVPDRDPEDEPPAVDLHQLRLAHHLHPDGGGRRVRHIDTRADCARSRLKAGGDAGTGGRLDQRDHRGSGEDGERPAADGLRGVVGGHERRPGPSGSDGEHATAMAHPPYNCIPWPIRGPQAHIYLLARDTPTHGIGR